MQGQDHNIWYLENIDVTNIFCPNKLGSDTTGHERTKYKKGDYIFQAEDYADKIFFLNQGRVKIGSYNDTGKEITKAILSKGEVFGELAIVKQGKRGDFAIAMEETDCCVIHVKDMQNLLREHSGLGIFLMKILGSRALTMETRLESLVFKDSRTRIIEYLAELVAKRGERVGFEHVVRKFITHQEIANLTATSRQTVTTVLNELRSDNIITFDRRRLLVRDLDKLKQEAVVPS